MRSLLIGSRKSDLARIQAQAVARELLLHHPQLNIKFDFRESLGDKNLQDPLWKMPEKGVFTEDFVDGLREARFDIVVHSWKDLPVEDHPDLAVVGALDRADPRDLLLIKKTHEQKIRESKKIRIFSSSPRRAFCLEKSLRELLPVTIDEIETVSVRGNIPTRMRKLFENSEIDALLLAKAAVDRILTTNEEEYAQVRREIHSNLLNCRWMILPLSLFPTAPAQGALAVQYRKDRPEIAALLEPLRRTAVEEAVVQERIRLSAMGGGCHQKMGCTVVPGSPAKEFLVGENVPTLVVEKAQWSSRNWSNYRIRFPLNFDHNRLVGAEGIIVSKFEAWPQDFFPTEKQLVWTAGVQTWAKLAKLGIWVNGTSDRFGLTVPEVVWAPLTQERVAYLTHEAAVKSRNDIATYKLEWKEQPPLPPENAKKLFLSSVGDLDMLLQIRGVKPDDVWITGLGETFSAAKKRLPSYIEHRGSWESL